MTTGSMAGDAARLLEHLGMSRAHVYGLSLGGMVAQELAIQHPNRVHGLVLGSTTPGGWRAVPAGPWTLLSAGNSMRSDLGSPNAIPALSALLQAWAAATHDTASRLHWIAAPTLILQGDQDRLVPTQNARLLAERIPHAELWMLKGQGHLYPFEDKEDSTHRVMAWLDELPIVNSQDRAGRNPLTAAMGRVGRHAISQLLPLAHARRSVCPADGGGALDRSSN